MNQVGIFGRLTRDPELKYTQQGKAVSHFSLAVNRFGDNEADFFDCEAWEKQAENIANSCKKGHRLLVWGRLKQERWTDQQTQQNRTAVKIVVSGFSFIEPPPQGQGQSQTQPPAGPPAYGQPPGYQPPGYGPPSPGYIPPNPGGYPPAGQPAYPGHMAPQNPGQYGQPPAGPYGQAPTGAAQQQIGFQPPGQHPGTGFSGNLNDIPF